MIASRRRFLEFTLLGGAAVAASGSAAAGGKVLKEALSVEPDTDNNACVSLLSHEFRPLMAPERQPLCDRFSEHVLLVVNTASKCGFTPQFEDLEALHNRYSTRNFSVLGFPSGDFRQELASEEAVAQFCELNYGVTFPMFEKIRVSGDDAHPFFRQLAQNTGSAPQWNFNKYLIDREGTPIAHYNSGVTPLSDKLIIDIEALL